MWRSGRSARSADRSTWTAGRSSSSTRRPASARSSVQRCCTTRRHGRLRTRSRSSAALAAWCGTRRPCACGRRRAGLATSPVRTWPRSRRPGSADGRTLWFVSGPAGRWEPVEAVTGRGVGDRRVTVWDAATGSLRASAHETGEEGVRPSRDGTRLLVLRRQTAIASNAASFPNVDLEVWLTDADGSHGKLLVRFPGSGLSAYGYQTGPTEWDWSE